MAEDSLDGHDGADSERNRKDQHRQRVEPHEGIEVPPDGVVERAVLVAMAMHCESCESVAAGEGEEEERTAGEPERSVKARGQPECAG